MEKVQAQSAGQNQRHPCIPALGWGLVAAMLWLFEGMKFLIAGTMKTSGQEESNVQIAARTYIFLLFFLGMLLILYTVSYYSRLRLREYGMFLVLGGDKSRVVTMILMEYGILCVFSYILGSAVGAVLLRGVQTIFQKEQIQVGLDGIMVQEIIGRTFFLMMVIYLSAVFFNVLRLHGNSLFSLLNVREKKSHLPTVKCSITGSVAGVFCLFVSVLLLIQTPVTYTRMKWGTFFALVSLYFCFTYSGNLALFLMKRKGTWYNRNIFQVKNLYYRFSENKNLILLVFVLHFFVLIFVNINVVEYGNTASRYLWKYPFDAVWMTEQQAIKEIEKAGGSGETEVYAYVPLTSPDGAAYIGISEASYQQLTGRNPGLQKGEVKAFPLKQETKEILFVAQQKELIRVLVLREGELEAMTNAGTNNENRGEETVEEGKTPVIVVQKAAKGEKLKEERAEETAEAVGAKLFLTERLMKEDRQEDIVTLIFYACMGIFLVCSSLTVLAIKVWSEIPGLRAKYRFLDKMGMDPMQQKRGIREEVSIYLKIPFWLSTFLGVGVMVYLCLFRSVCVTLMVEILVGFILLTLLQILYIEGVKVYGYWLTANGAVYENSWKGGKTYGAL